MALVALTGKCRDMLQGADCPGVPFRQLDLAPFRLRKVCPCVESDQEMELDPRF